MKSSEPKAAGVNRNYQKISTSLAFVAKLAIAVMGLSTTVDVFKRWVTGWPIGGVMQLSECLMVVLVFLGLAYAQFHRRHIRVTFVLCRMKPKNIVRMDIISCVIQIIILVFLAWKTLEEGIWSISILEYRVGDVRLPIYWARMMIPIGVIAFIGQLILDIWLNVEKLKGHISLELPDVRRIQEIV